MHARGSRVGTANATVPVSAEDTFPAQAALTNGHTEPAQVDAPDPLELSKYIQDLLASLDQPPLQADPHATAIDPKALLATLNEPLPLPPGFLVEPQTGTTSNLQYLQQYPFADSNPASTTAQSFSGTLASDLARLPEHLKRGASILDDNVPRTIDPSQLHSPAKVNGYHYHSSSLPSFSYHDQDRHDSPRQGVNDHSYREYAPPVSMDDWSDGDSDDDGEPDLSQDFVQHSYDGPDGAGDFGTETWQEPTNGIDLNNTDNDAGDLQTHDNGDTSSSSDSDIPTEALININTSRSHRSETPRQASHQHSPTYNRQLSQESESLDNNQPDYEPYGPVAPITHTVAAPYSQVSQPAFPAQSKCAAADTVSSFLMKNVPPLLTFQTIVLSSLTSRSTYTKSSIHSRKLRLQS